jgi:hypothetical protein
MPAGGHLLPDGHPNAGFASQTEQDRRTLSAKIPSKNMMKPRALKSFPFEQCNSIRGKTSLEPLYRRYLQAVILMISAQQEKLHASQPSSQPSNFYFKGNLMTPDDMIDQLEPVVQALISLGASEIAERLLTLQRDIYHLIPADERDRRHQAGTKGQRDLPRAP